MTVASESSLERPDYVAGSLLRSLDQPYERHASWGWFRTTLLTVLSFGLAPLLVWPRQLRDLMFAERHRYRHLAEWMQSISGDRANRLDTAAERIGPIASLSYLPAVIPLIVIGFFARAMLMHSGPKGVVVMGSTWQFAQNLNRTDAIVTLFYVWTIGLGVGYAMHWLQLMSHQSRIRDTVTEFNHLAAAEGLAPVPVTTEIGLRPMWLIAGVLLTAAGSAVWALPAMIGGAVQRRYATIAVPATQLQLAQRVKQLMAHRRPAMLKPTTVATPRRCPNDQCRAPMQKVANFCPRCGRHVGPEVNAVA